MKPIEPGCLAIFVGLKIDVDINGTTVEVIQYDAVGSELWEEPHWIVYSQARDRSGPVRAKNLMRIDGGDFKGEEEHDQIRQSESCC